MRSYTAPSSLPEDSSHDAKISRGVYDGYIHLGSPERGAVPARPLQTFVHHGKADDLNHDGIHLTYEMQQNSTTPEA